MLDFDTGLKSRWVFLHETGMPVDHEKKQGNASA